MTADHRTNVYEGAALRSVEPASGATLWEGTAADAATCAAAVGAARAAFPAWARTPLGDRIALVRRFATMLKEDGDAFAPPPPRRTLPA